MSTYVGHKMLKITTKLCCTYWGAFKYYENIFILFCNQINFNSSLKFLLFIKVVNCI